MRTIVTASVLFGLLIIVPVCVAQEFPEMPGPVKQHEMLQKLAGEWEVNTELSMGPGGEKIKFEATENFRKLGPFWIIGESKGTAGDMKVESKLTLGYDLNTNKVVGSWIDSVQSYQWVYEGEFDDTGKVLTLNTTGPCPLKPGTMSKFKEVLELKDDNTRLFTSSMQQEDGTWMEIMSVESRRKK
jgi:hypothetical protein